MSPIISSLSTVRSSYGFGRRIVISTIGGGVTSDSNFGDVSLLLYGDGTNGSTAIVDSSSNNHAITVNGDAQISTTQSKFGGSSMYFDGAGDYLTVPASDDFSFPGDFTVEFWIKTSTYSQDTSYRRVISNGPNSANSFQLVFYDGSGATQRLGLYQSGVSMTITGTIDVADGSWHHVALSRDGSSMRLFVDGVQSGGTANVSTSLSSGSTYGLIVGRYQGGNGHFEGYLDELRITKGVARYTSDFTPPTASFSTVAPGEKYFYQNSLLLYGDGTNSSTAIVDSSANAHTITVNGDAQISTTQSKFGGSSMYFDGSGDYLTAAANSDFAFDGDFTIEFWMKTSTYNQDTYYRRVVSTGPDAAGSIQILFYNGGATPNISVYSSGQIISGTIDAADDSWHHVALSRSGSSMKLFVDGVQSGSTSSSTTNFSSGSTYGLIVGRYQAGNGHFDGYLDDIRITKGVARYTSNFTPPTAGFSTLTPVEPYFHNNSLLLHGDGTNGSTTFTDDSINNHTITANGNAQISTAQKKFGGSSLYFDGSDDYLSIADDDAFNFGSGDFTMEVWIYMTSQGSFNYLVGQYGSSASVSRTFWSIANGYNDCYFYGSSTVRLTGTTSISLNTWTHVAVSREGNTVRLFTNGQVDASGSFDQTLNNSTKNFTVGADSDASYDFSGYMDDIRITKGVARYTANFTPPTSAFSDL